MHHLPDEHNDYLRDHATLLANSYKRLIGIELLGPPLLDTAAEPFSGAELALRLFEAPFAIVSHDTAPDPIFNYANRTALELFEMSWSEFTALPSRFSAEPVHRDERALLMARVAANGYIDDYQGIRIAKSGRRFRIERATVWNLVESGGDIRGQAAAFRHWTFL